MLKAFFYKTIANADLLKRALCFLQNPVVLKLNSNNVWLCRTKHLLKSCLGILPTTDSAGWNFFTLFHFACLRIIARNHFCP